MSVSYTSILWNKSKRQYDLAILVMILSFLVLFSVLHAVIHPDVTFETIIIRAFGWLALIMLHVILIIGPLARLNPVFNIVLYNRRHLGVSMFLCALIHGGFSIMQFHALGDMNPVRSVFLSNLRYDSFAHFPFQVLGFLALLILGLMAVSSHDFWLKNLGPRVWKSLHMLVYMAYTLLLLHVILGGLQNETSPIIYSVLFIAAIGVIGLHIISGSREYQVDSHNFKNREEWINVATVADIPLDRAVIITLGDNRVAVFKYGNSISAVSNYCRHQGGPLGEGKIVDGCITCPWHGYQYLPHNGQSPPPFTEKIETYDLRLHEGIVQINTKAHPPGTDIEPLVI